jgi:hypothetical protein
MEPVGARCTNDASKSLDPVADSIAAVFHHWAEVIGDDRRITVKDAIAAAIAAANGAPCQPGSMDLSNAMPSRPGLLDAFNAVAAPMVKGAGERADPRRLGKWLGKHKNRVIDGHRIVLVPEKRDGNAQWCLEKVGNGGKVGSSPLASEKCH